MSDTTTDPSSQNHHPTGRRDFLYLSTGAVASVGALASLWPLINSMNPAKDVLAFASTEVDISPIQVGQRLTITWRGQPIFIDHRTQEQIDWAIKDDGADLRDPALDSERAQKAEWLVVIGICTHLGCVPLGQRVGTPRGGWGGWFCPCHGSHYDTAGRIRKGPAPLNLWLPPYEYITDTLIRIG